MKLETFFEKFDQFADAPDAVEKMRELVRHLAVTGKLVAQDPHDESGELLLKKINAERLAAVKARQISPMKPLAVVGEDELSFELQPGWAAARLVELVMEIQTGPFGSSLHKSDYELGGTPVINPASLKDGKIIPIDEMAIGHATLKRLEVFKLCAGDIVMARRGEMGRCAIVTKNEDGWLCGTGSLVLRMPHSLHAPYLAMLIGAPMARTYLGGASVGTTMQNLNQSILAKMPVGVPPLAEQKRIVAKVDEVMALCDRLEAQQQEGEIRRGGLARASLARFADAPTAASLPFLFHPSYPIPLADLRKSILTLAVQGKLVPQDPNDEPAARVLERIDAAPKRAMRTRTTDEEEGDEPTELETLFELPRGWEWAPFRRLPLQASVGIDRGRSMQGPDKAVGYFKMNNIRNSGGVDLSDLTRIDATPDEVEAFALADGDFLFNTRNSRELVGKTCVFRAQSDDPVLYNNNILRVRFIEGFSPDFLDYWFRSPEGSAELEKLKSNTTNVCAIYQGKLSGFPCAIPPLAEQRRIVTKVDQLMALVDELETQLAASRATAANLLSALVAELTAGESSPALKTAA